MSIDGTFIVAAVFALAILLTVILTSLTLVGSFMLFRAHQHRKMQEQLATGLFSLAAAFFGFSILDDIVSSNGEKRFTLEALAAKAGKKLVDIDKAKPAEAEKPAAKGAGA